MSTPSDDESTAAPALGDDVTDDGVFRAVLDGYDAVYDALPQSETFNRSWRTHAYNADFPEEFAHIGFLTTPEAQRLRDVLRLETGDVLADVACGGGGPGLWIQETHPSGPRRYEPVAPCITSSIRAICAREQPLRDDGLDRDWRSPGR